MIVHSRSNYTEEPLFTEETQSILDFFKPVEEKLKLDIKNLKREIEEKYNIHIMPIVSEGEVDLVFTIDMDKVYL